MSEAGFQDEILSREELDALLASLAEDRAEKEIAERAAAPPLKAARGSGRGRQALYPTLARALDQWALELGHRLSAIHQVTIQCQLAGWQQVKMGDLAETLAPHDVVAAFEVAPPRGVGFVLIGRPVLFSLLTLALGGRGVGKAPAPPVRPYTRIERRFYAALAGEMVSQLEECWSELVDARTRLIGIDEPERLLEESHASAILATVEVSGLGDFARVRVAIPPEPFHKLQVSQMRFEPSRRDDVVKAVLGMPVELRVEAGEAQLSLSELSSLRVGATIPLDPAAANGLLVRVEGEPKFLATRGAVGRRLAVQVTKRLGRVGDGDE